MPWREVRSNAPGCETALAIAVGTVPAGLAGVFLHDWVEEAFQADLRVPGALLFVTGLALLATRWAPQGTRSRVGPASGLLVGTAQALALLPGISRSGATIAAGYFAGLERGTAGRFSFLLAVPALLGAMVLEAARFASGGGETLAARDLLGLACGALVAALVGALCLALLLRVIRRGRLHWFAAYCLPVGAALVLIGCLT